MKKEQIPSPYDSSSKTEKHDSALVTYIRGTRSEYVKRGVNWSIRALLIVALGGAILNQNWLVVLPVVATLLLTFLPYAFERRYRIDLPEEFEILVVVFAFATLFLGEVHAYYTRFFWWDVLLHSISAFALGIIGFTAMYILYRSNRFKASPFLVAFIGFSFAVMIGTLWEIFEFAMDAAFGLNMQRSGLVDTMWDAIVNVAAAFLAAVIGYVYARTGQTLLFGRVIRGFERSNPRFFLRRRKTI